MKEKHEKHFALTLLNITAIRGTSGYGFSASKLVHGSGRKDIGSKTFGY
jgi:hypothetical protein